MNKQMKTVIFAGGLLLAAAPVSAQTTIFASTRSVTSQAKGGPDGVAAGDMDGDGRPEIAYNLRFGRDPLGSGTSNDSSLAVYGVTGSSWALKFQINVTNPYAFVGFPSFGDFDGDGKKEVAVCSLHATAGACRAYGSTGTELTSMAITGLANASNTNGGPAVADVNGDSYDDLIVSTYGGKVILKPGNSASGFTYDLWVNKADWTFGHPAVGDLFNDGNKEIVVGGARYGSIYVISKTGSFLASSPAVYDLTTKEGYFYYGSGPSLADLDADRDLEVVSILDYHSQSGAITNPRLVVHQATSSSVTEVASATLPNLTSFSTPMVGDVTGDHLPEIVLIDNKGVVRLYKYVVGNPVLQVVGAPFTVDTASWASPALFDTDGDGTLEIAVTGATGAHILSANSAGTLTNKYLWSASTATNVFPQPIIVDADGDAAPEMFTGSWGSSQLVAIDLPFRPSTDWSAFGRNGKHQGSVTSGSELIGSDLSLELSSIIDNLEVVPTGCTSAGDSSLFASAADLVQTGYRAWLRGSNTSPNQLTNNLRLAQNDLATVSAGCNSSYYREKIAYASALALKQYIDRGTPILGPSDSVITTAVNNYSAALVQLAGQNWSGAVLTIKNATPALTTKLHAVTTTISTTSCTTGTREPYLAAECTLIGMYASLGGANLQSLVLYLPDPWMFNANGFANAAATDMAGASAADRLLYITTVKNATRAYLDDVKIWFGQIDPTGMVDAESYYTQALTAITNGNYPQAASRLKSAVNKARPCPDPDDGVVGDVACL